jgi:hypothetical protein
MRPPADPTGAGLISRAVPGGQMTQDLIVRMFDRIDHRDWTVLPSMYCEDAVYERPGYDAIVGRDSLEEFYRRVRVIECGTHQITRIVADEQAGACWGRFVGRCRDGSAVDVRFADCYQFESGRIKHRVSYFFVPSV